MNSDIKDYISKDDKKLQIYNLLFTYFGEELSNWNRINIDIGNTLFYDIIFDILHLEYINNLKTNSIKYKNKTFIPKNFISYFVSKSNDILIYLFNKLNINENERYNDIKLGIKDIEEYVYFKSCPNLLYKIKYHDNLPRQKPKNIEIDGFKWEYFIWRKKDDENLKSAEPSLKITNDNFYNYRIFKNSLHGWSKIQLKTFLNTVIIPYFLKEANLKINIQHKIYSQYIDSILPQDNVGMGNLINLFITGKRLNKHILEIIDNVIIKSKEKTPILKIFKELSKNNYDELVKETWEGYKDVYKLIVYLKYNKKLMNLFLLDKISKIKKKFLKKGLRRFKWQDMCSVLTKTTHLQTLRELAIVEEIPNYTMMTKRQLCKAFSEKLQEMIDSKNNLIKNNKCTNDISYLTGEKVEEISPEFFIDYEHNNKIYCDDIRAMKTQIDTNDGMHPGFRQKLSKDVINKINNVHNKLLKTTNTLNDLNEINIELSPESNLQSQMTNLILKTRDNGYINNQQLYIDADQKTFESFINKLKDNFILSEKEKSYIEQFNKLINKKIKLVELLSLKIDNDPLRQGNISEIANNLVTTYNEIFSN